MQYLIFLHLNVFFEHILCSCSWTLFQIVNLLKSWPKSDFKVFQKTEKTEPCIEYKIFLNNFTRKAFDNR